jgi:hypothetical protein
MIRVAIELANFLVINEYFILLGVPERGSKRVDAFLIHGDGGFAAQSLSSTSFRIPRKRYRADYQKLLAHIDAKRSGSSAHVASCFGPKHLYGADAGEE